MTTHRSLYRECRLQIKLVRFLLSSHPEALNRGMHTYRGRLLYNYRSEQKGNKKKIIGTKQLFGGGGGSGGRDWHVVIKPITSCLKINFIFWYIIFMFWYIFPAMICMTSWDKENEASTFRKLNFRLSPAPPTPMHTHFHSSTLCQDGACVSVTVKHARLAWSSPEGPSSASGGCVATVVACPGWKVSSPWAEAGPRETAVCGANARAICSLGPNL